MQLNLSEYAVDLVNFIYYILQFYKGSKDALGSYGVKCYGHMEHLFHLEKKTKTGQLLKKKFVKPTTVELETFICFFQEPNTS